MEIASHVSTRSLPALVGASVAALIPHRSPQLDVRWASSEEEVREAQRLRYRIFAGEMGAQLPSPSGAPPELDIDRFDPFCDHLLVRAIVPGQEPRKTLVGTYRVLAPSAARRAGGFYTDTEFDLTPLSQLRARAVELGRSCVHPSWRSGAVIMALWTALGDYMRTRELDTMIGCASVGLSDGGQTANDLWHRLRVDHLVAPQWQVRPHIALPLEGESTQLVAAHRLTDTPPLIKGYLRCGARLLGPPALDVAFNAADLPLMLQLEHLAPRYRKHFLGS